MDSKQEHNLFDCNVSDFHSEGQSIISCSRESHTNPKVNITRAQIIERFKETDLQLCGPLKVNVERPVPQYKRWDIPTNITSS